MARIIAEVALKWEKSLRVPRAGAPERVQSPGRAVRTRCVFWRGFNEFCDVGQKFLTIVSGCGRDCAPEVRDAPRSTRPALALPAGPRRIASACRVEPQHAVAPVQEPIVAHPCLVVGSTRTAPASSPAWWQTAVRGPPAAYRCGRRRRSARRSDGRQRGRRGNCRESDRGN